MFENCKIRPFRVLVSCHLAISSPFYKLAANGFGLGEGGA